MTQAPEFMNQQIIHTNDEGGQIAKAPMVGEANVFLAFCCGKEISLTTNELLAKLLMQVHEENGHSEFIIDRDSPTKLTDTQLLATIVYHDTRDMQQRYWAGVGERGYVGNHGGLIDGPVGFALGRNAARLAESYRFAAPELARRFIEMKEVLESYEEGGDE